MANPNPTPRPRKLEDPELRAAFLLAYERSGEILPAASAVGIAASTVYDQRDRDPELAADMELARGRLVEAAFKTLKEVAVTGVVEKFYDSDGNLIREKRTVNPKLLDRLITRHCEAWKPVVQVDKTVTGKVQHEHRGRIDISSIPERDREALFDIVARNGLASKPSEN